MNKLPRPGKSILNRVKIENVAPNTPEPATPADNERSDPTFNVKDENRRRRTRAPKTSDSVSPILSYQKLRIKFSSTQPHPPIQVASKSAIVNPTAKLNVASVAQAKSNVMLSFAVVMQINA